MNFNRNSQRLAKQFYQMATKTQSKTTTVTALASKIKVDNILQLSLVQSTLQANFKAILEALSDHDTGISKNKDDNKNNQDNLKNLQTSHDLMGKEIHDLKEALSKILKENSAIKSQIANNEKKNGSNNSSLNPEADLKYSNLLEQINKELEAIREKQAKLENSFSKNVENTRLELDKIKKDISELTKSNQSNGKTQETSAKLKQLQKALKQMQGKNKQMLTKLTQVQKEVTKSGEDKEDFSEISKLIQDLNKRLEDFSNQQYMHSNEGINDRLNKLQKLSQQNKSAVEEEKRLRSKLSQQLWKVHDTVSKVSENNFSQQMTSDTLKQLKRQLAQLQKKINDMTSLSPNKQRFNDTTAYTHLNESPSKYKTVDNQSPNKGDSNNNADLKEEMLERIKQVKSDIMRHLKKLDFKNEGDSAYDKKRLDAMDEAILRLDHLLSEKAGTDSVKKLVSHIEGKVQYIYNVFLSGESEQDACVARKNWVCLSCDKNLEKYQGKIGNYLVNDKLRVKNLEQDTVGGGMTLRPSKSKVDLPNVYSKTAKKI